MGAVCGSCSPAINDPAARRVALKEKKPQFFKGSMMRDIDNGVIRLDEYMQSEGGYLLFTRTYLPLFDPKTQVPRIKGLLCYCEGFSDTMDWMMDSNMIRLCRDGYVVFTLDHFSHGRSEGLWISHTMEQIVDDARRCFGEIRRRLNDRHSTVCLHLAHSCVVSDDAMKNPTGASVTLPLLFDESNCFLGGQSMGGGMCVGISLKESNLWRGMILIAPMVAIHEDLIPPSCVVSCMKNCLLPCCPNQQWTPSKSINDSLFADPQFLEELEANPLLYESKLRLKTGYSMFQFTLDLESKLSNIALPFLVLHGSADVVTDPAMSRKLYESAFTADKSIKIYKDAWHCLYEDPNSRPEIFADISTWMKIRLKNSKSGSNSRRASHSSSLRQRKTVRDVTEHSPLLTTQSESSLTDEARTNEDLLGGVQRAPEPSISKSGSYNE